MTSRDRTKRRNKFSTRGIYQFPLWPGHYPLPGKWYVPSFEVTVSGFSLANFLTPDHFEHVSTDPFFFSIRTEANFAAAALDAGQLSGSYHGMDWIVRK